MEKEINNEISYLNLLVERRNIDFETTVFRKDTFTDNYLNFGHIVAKSVKPTSSGLCVIVHIWFVLLNSLKTKLRTLSHY